MKTDTVAVAMLVMAVAIFTVLFSIGRMVDPGVGAAQIQAIRNGAAVLILLGLFARRPGVWGIWRHHPRLILARSGTGVTGGALLIYGVANMPVAEAMSLALLDGVMAVVLGALFLRERVSVVHGLLILMAFGGGLVVILGSGARVDWARVELVPAAAVTLGAVLLASETVFLRVLSLRSDPIPALLAVAISGMSFMAPVAAWQWQPMSALSWGLILAMGPAALFGQYLNVVGYRRVPVSIAAPLGYTAIVFAGLLGWAGFGEVPSLATLVGGTVIALAGIGLARTRAFNPSPAPAAPGRR